MITIRTFIATAALVVFVLSSDAQAVSGQAFSPLKPQTSTQSSLLIGSSLSQGIAALPAPAEYQAAAYPMSAAAPYQPYEVVYDSNNRFYTGRQEQYLVTYDATTAQQTGEIWFDGHEIYSLAWSESHQRLYVGLGNGEIRYVDPAEPDVFQLFATLTQAVIGLGDAGNYLLAVDGSGAWESHHTFSVDGDLIDSKEWNHYSRVYAWNSVLNRTYYFQDYFGPNDLHHETIDQATGEIGADVESPYHGDYAIQPPILISPAGDRVLLGSGDVYDSDSLLFVGSLSTDFVAGVWSDDGGTVVVSDIDGQSRLQRRISTGLLVESFAYEGIPQALIPSGDGYRVITAIGSVFHSYSYIPSDDSDNDGVLNIEDSFPTDPAASIDSDGDGYPDEWNAGMGPDDSTTGLTLDAYPNDAACYFPEHGDGTICDYGSTIPDYAPDSVFINGNNVVHLLSQENSKIYRWDSATGEHLNPVIVGRNEGLSVAAPNTMGLHSGHNRIYLGYEDGTVTYVDATNPAAEQDFIILTNEARDVIAVGDNVVVSVGSYNTELVSLNENGVIIDSSNPFCGVGFPVWSPALNRIFHTRNGCSPNDIQYVDLDPVSGAFGSEGESPYHGDYSIVPPIRVSQDGGQLMMGSGDIYSGTALEWIGSIAVSFTDAAWAEDGGNVVISNSGDNTLLQRRTPELLLTEQVIIDNVPVAILPTGDGYIVVGQSGQPTFAYFEPSDDSDGDGVLNDVDAFPLDPAASVDTDGDGFPDQWNDGMTAADSTTGLELDAYPDDSACFLPEHGDGVNCDYGATIPDYEPEDVFIDEAGIVYALSGENLRIYRYDSVAEEHLNPLPVGRDAGFIVNGPVSMGQHAAQNRIYLGYEDGTVTYIDLSKSIDEIEYAFFPDGIQSIFAANDRLMVVSGYYNSRVFHVDVSGTILDEQPMYCGIASPTWNSDLNRVYYIYSGCSPNDILYRDVDPVTGMFGNGGESDYHGDYIIQQPILFSQDGTRLLLGSGDIYDTQTLTWTGALATSFKDGAWNGNAATTVISEHNGQTLIERRSDNLNLSEQLLLDSPPIAMLPRGEGYVIVGQANKPVFTYYEPSDDTDNDNVPNIVDAFPTDASAAVDSDGDGYPDYWNPRQGADNSTTGLTMDAYPEDSACFLAEHGEQNLDGTQGRCDIVGRIPAYTPDRILMDKGGMMYTLSRDNYKIYRWHQASQQHLNPIVFDTTSPFASDAPATMEYSPEHDRMYLGYSSGLVTYINLKYPQDEVPFVTVAGSVQGVASIGDRVLVQDPSGAWNTHYIFDRDGNLLDSEEWNRYSRHYAWNDALSRVYFRRDGTSPNDLEYEDIDPATGEIVGSGDSPYHSSHLVYYPIRVSPDGSKVMLGSGNVYDAVSLVIIDNITSRFIDGLWTQEGGTVLLKLVDGATRLERRNSDRELLEVVEFPGEPIALRQRGDQYTVVTAGITPQFHSYVINDDLDGDGVENVSDAFPEDPAASVDSDGDGYPDYWNTGYGPDDSTTGLQLDAFSNDTACYLAEHDDGTGNCDYSVTIPEYMPDEIVIDDQGIVYLLSSDNFRIYRWNSATEEHLDPLVAGLNRPIDPIRLTSITFSVNHGRVYQIYDNNEITYFEVSAPLVEVPFVTAPGDVDGIASVGDYVMTHVDTGSWSTHTVFNLDGVQTDYNEYSNEILAYTWNPLNERIYFVDGVGNYARTRSKVIEQSTGLMGGWANNNSMASAAPVRISADGLRGLSGAGSLFDTETLDLTGSLPNAFVDGQWTVDDETVVIRAAQNGTVLERRSVTGALVETFGLDEEPVALRPVGSSYLLVTWDQYPQFQMYTPSDDSDGDTVPNNQDAFPLDPAASLDTDGDGYPDSWNVGYGSADSTTGLQLDAYPNDSACYLTEHGDGTVCDYSSTIPEYEADVVVGDNAGRVFVLSAENNKVYVWNAIEQQHSNPIIVGDSNPLSPKSPEVMAHVPSHNRLYFGYDSGEITYVDLTDLTTENYFASLPQQVEGLANAGNYLLAQDPSNGERHYVFSADGQLTHPAYGGEYSRAHGWSELYDRIYYFRDGSSPNDLLFQNIDQTTGEITGQGDSPYHGTYTILPPIRVSPGGDRVLLGSGDVYDAFTLQHEESIGPSFIDGQWTSSGGQVVIRSAAGSNTIIERLSSDGVIEGQDSAPGTPISVIPVEDYFVVVSQGAQPVFTRYVPLNDIDGDGIDNLDDAFPEDPAASTDTDRDGYPDMWNLGYTQDDSTTGLTLDAFPLESGCYLSEHADDGVCNPGSSVPAYAPDLVTVDENGIIYLLSRHNQRIYRWDGANGRYLNPFIVGVGFLPRVVEQIMFSADHSRLYVRYDDDTITYFNPEGPDVENVFVTSSEKWLFMLDAGSHVVLVEDRLSFTKFFRVFDQQGIQTDLFYSSDLSPVSAWNKATERLYFFNRVDSPGVVKYAEFSSAGGTYLFSGFLAAYSGHELAGPIRLSPDYSHMVLGNGRIYNTVNGTYISTADSTFTDLRWNGESRYVGLNDESGQTRVSLRNFNGDELDHTEIDGAPLALANLAGGQFVVVTQGMSPEFHLYEPAEPVTDALQWMPRVDTVHRWHEKEFRKRR